MELLSKQAFDTATQYIKQNADPINQAWYSYNFEEMPTDAFMDVLTTYQHDNGGFGGLYYEFDYQGPCLKSTEVAIKYILELNEKPPANHPMIQRMMGYILNGYHPEIGNWGDVAEPEVNNGVHCHWVRYRGEEIIAIENEDERIEKYDANEKVCFAAFVALYSDLVPNELYHDIIKYPIEYILRYYDKNSPTYKKAIFDEGCPYDFEYFQWFIPCLKDKDMANKLTSVLCQNPCAFMELDYAKSQNDYVHLPCDSVRSPESIIYTAVKELVDNSLEYRMKQQSTDGRWPLGWSMGESEEFRKLQTLYEIYRTVDMLVKLKKFGRIER